MPVSAASSETITDEDLDRFRERGFLVVRGLAGPERVRALRTAAEADLAAPVGEVEYEADVHYPGAPAGRNAPGGRTVRRLKGVLDRHPAFRAWALDPAVTGRVAALLETTDWRVVRAHHNCVMTKHPRFSSATLWHQDIRYWSYQRNELVNAWTALGPETRDNGCMRIIPGSHRLTLTPDRLDELKFLRREHPDNRTLIRTAERCELDPGDVLFFHSGALHAAGRNRTDQRKMAAVFTYRAADNPPLPGSRSAGRPDIAPDEAS